MFRKRGGTRCVLFFHGGGYSYGNAPLYQDFMWRVGTAARASVLYFDYRLAPEHPFPAAVDDAVRVARWVATQFDPQRIAFVGDSAGGGLVLATMKKLRDQADILPRAAVAVSPWTDLALTGQSLRTNYKADPMMDAAQFPEIAKRYLGRRRSARSLCLAAVWRRCRFTADVNPGGQRRSVVG